MLWLNFYVLFWGFVFRISSTTSHSFFLLARLSNKWFCTLTKISCSYHTSHNVSIVRNLSEICAVSSHATSKNCTVINPLLHSNSLSLTFGMLLPLDTDQGEAFTPLSAQEYQHRDIFMANIATPCLPTMELWNSLQIWSFWVFLMSLASINQPIRGWTSSLARKSVRTRPPR